MAFDAMLYGPQADPQLAGTPQAGLGINGPDPIAQEVMTPAKTSEEVASRAGVWKNLFADPKFQQALLFFGTSLMQPQQPGQTNAGQVGQAIQVGASAWNMLGEREREAGLAERAMQRIETESASRVALQNEQLQGARQQRDLLNQRIPGILREDQLKLDHLEAQIAGAKTVNEKNALLVKHQQLTNAILEKYGAQEAQADIASKRASAFASSAAGRRSTALAAGEENENRILAKIAKDGYEALTPGEQQIYNTRMDKTGTKAAGSAQVALRNQVRASLKKAYPELTEQQLEQKLLSIDTGRKEGLADQLKLVESLQNSEDPAIRAQADVLLRALLGGDKPGTPGAKSAGQTVDASRFANPEQYNRIVSALQGKPEEIVRSPDGGYFKLEGGVLKYYPKGK